MTRRTLESLGALVKAKRGQRKLRETAKDIGIGPATLMRIENGRVPDLNTFGLVCKWLGIQPGEFLGFERQGGASKDSDLATLSVHMRADKATDAATVNSLAKMIALAAKIQPPPQEVHAEL